MYGHTSVACSALEYQKGASGVLELELEMPMSCHVGAEV